MSYSYIRCCVIALALGFSALAQSAPASAGEMPGLLGVAPTLIHDVQGTGTTSAIAGQLVLVEAIVVGDFQNGDSDTSRDLGGFYLQEEDADADAEPATSEGVFVFENGNFIRDVSLGDLVQVSGTVADVAGETHITEVTNIAVLSGSNALPSAASIALSPAGATTLAGDGSVQPDLEAFEGMRVTFADTLTVTETFQLPRFNEIKLSQGGRLEQFTQRSDPDVEGFAAHLQAIGARTIVYDDGLNVQNALIGNLDGFGPTFSTATDIRMGDVINNLSGVLSYQWAGNAASPETWRVRATQNGQNTFEKANVRPLIPDPVGGSLTIAGFNVLNYFTTLRDGGPTAIGASPRGASNAGEFERQTEKLVAALALLDADIVGLVELENDFLPGANGNALENLVAELNGVVGPGTYSWADPGSQFVGVGAISNGLIYKPASVTLVASDTLVFQELSAASTVAVADVLNPFVNAASQVISAQRTRPALAATFQDNQGEQVTVAVNHFKSKSDSNLQDLATAAQALLDAGATGFSQSDVDNLLADPNYDQADGQSFWNALRLETADGVRQWLTDRSASGYAGGSVNDPDVLIIGDLNSYGAEDPVRTLTDQGFADLAADFTADPISFVFGGQSGTLDYAMASPTLGGQVSGVTIWNINADEATAIDYNTDFGRDVAIFDGSTPFRASDHDPIVVGLNLVQQPDALFADGFE